MGLRAPSKWVVSYTITFYLPVTGDSCSGSQFDAYIVCVAKSASGRWGHRNKWKKKKNTIRRNIFIDANRCVAYAVRSCSRKTKKLNNKKKKKTKWDLLGQWRNNSGADGCVAYYTRTAQYGSRDWHWHWLVVRLRKFRKSGPVRDIGWTTVSDAGLARRRRTSPIDGEVIARLPRTAAWNSNGCYARPRRDDICDGPHTI